ncbi:MAG: 4Fe-4S binding protein, partial [Rubrivivax sp.]|nr:4Fe-4S binding protein [Pyrinomonadaceae bacterium]
MSGPTTGPDEGEDEWWVGVLRWAALAVFVAIPVGAPFAQKIAGRLVWTVGVAAIPIFIVLVGYHRWRRLCPLAFFAQLPWKLGWQGKRKAPAWLEQNYYYFVVAIFVFSLWLRLIATNGDGYAISAFFTLLSLSALVSGFVFTGKTWCNYICPVSFIEKIYTEPNGIRETPNS